MTDVTVVTITEPEPDAPIVITIAEALAPVARSETSLLDEHVASRDAHPQYLTVDYAARFDPLGTAAALADTPLVPGDTTGPIGGPQTVIGVQGQPWSTVPPNVGEVPMWSGEAWLPATPPTATKWPQVGGGVISGVTTGPVTGDASGTLPGAITVTGLQGNPFSSAAPSINDVPIWSGTAWVPGAQSGGGGGSSTYAGLTDVSLSSLVDANVSVYKTSDSKWHNVAISGDATLANTGALTFATVNSNVGSFGDATHVSALTVNAKGLVTAAASTAIALGATGDATGTLPGALTFATVNGNVGSFGDSTHVGAFTVNAKGLITAASSVSLTALSDRLGLTPTAVKTTTYTAAAGDLVPCDTTSAGFTVTLPTAPADGSVIAVKHVIRGSTNVVTVAAGGSDVFNKSGGGTSQTITLVNQGMLFQYKSSSAVWYIVTADFSLATLDSRYTAAVTTTRGDLIVRGPSADQRLGLGAGASLLMSGATDPSWVVMTGDAVIASTGIITLADTAITPGGTFGDASHIPVLTCDSKGRITAVTSTAISAAGSGPFLDTSAFTSLASQNANGAYDSLSSNIQYTAPSANYTIPQVNGYEYIEPILVGSGAIAPFTRTVVVKYTAGNAFMVKVDGTAFVAGDVGSTVTAGSGVQAATTISSLSNTNHQANLNQIVLTTQLSVSKVLTRGTSATGYTGSGALPSLTTQYGVFVPPLSVATNNWAAYLAGTTIDGTGQIAAIANVDIATTGVLIAEATTGHLFGETTGQRADATVEINGYVHVTTGSFGLHFISTGFSGTKSSLDTRQTRAPSLAALAIGDSSYASQAGDVLGAWHVGSSYSNALRDSAQIYCVAEELHSSTASGTRWEFYTTLNTTNTKTQALVLGNDKKATFYGALNANSGALTTNGAFTMAGALTGANNVLYTDGTVALTTTVVSTILRWDATGGSTGAGSLNLQGSHSTSSTWAAMQVGDILGQINLSGQYDTTLGHTRNGVFLVGVAEETWTTSTAAARYEVRTTPTGSTTPTRRMLIDSAGTTHWAPTIASNLVSASNAALKADGSLFAGAGLTYSSNQPTAANFSIDTSGNGIMLGTFAQGTAGANTWDTAGNLSRGAVANFLVTSTASAGVNLRLVEDTGAAQATATNLNSITFAGAQDNAHTLANGVQLIAASTAAWSSTVHGARLDIYTRPNTTSAGITHAGVFDQDGTFGVGSSTTGTSNPFNVSAAGDTTVQSLNSALHTARVADLAKTNSTFADAFVAAGMLTNTKYLVRGFLIVDVGAAGATCGWKFQFHATSSMTVSQMNIRTWALRFDTTAVSGTTTTWTEYTALDTATIDTTTVTNSAIYLIYVEGTLTTSHAGGISAQFAQHTTNATAATLKAGSHLSFDPIT